MAWAIVVRVACAVCALAAVLLALMAWSDLYFTGFPDSHLTDFDKAAELPKNVLMWGEWVFVTLFLVLAIVPMRTGVRAGALIAGMVALGLVVLIQWVGIPWYFIDHLRLDNGIGG